MKKILVLVLVFVLMLVPANAFAGEDYFAEDFETYPADTGYYPDTFFAGMAVNPYYAEVRDYASTKWFFIEQENLLITDSGVSVHLAPFIPIPDETQLTATFNFISPLQDGNVGMLFGTMEAGYMFITIYDDGSIVDMTPGSFVEIAPASTISPNVIYNFKMVTNLVTGMGQFYVNDVQIGGDVTLVVPGMDVGSSIMLFANDGLYGNGLSAQAYFDNINVTGTFEPANPRTGDVSIAREMLVKQ